MSSIQLVQSDCHVATLAYLPLVVVKLEQLLVNYLVLHPLHISNILIEYILSVLLYVLS